MRFVLDVSVAISWCFKDENAPLALTVAQHMALGATALVPMIWWFEIRNGVLIGERKRRATVEETALFIQDLSRQRVDLDPHPSGDAVFSFARRHRLTFYDAAYLELATRENLPLATLDKALAAAAKAEGIALIGA